MISRLREKQYQVAAQKRNEAYLKHDYYERTARYFERQSEIARQYDAWNVKLLRDPRGSGGRGVGSELERGERERKAERLLVRRNKLRDLLKEEEELYQRELQESRARKKRRDDDASLEALRAKLRESRMEQDLYLPSTCRRLRSYFLEPRQQASSGIASARDSQLSSHFTDRSYLKDSTNLRSGKQLAAGIRTNGMFNWKGREDLDASQKDPNRFTEYRPRNRKYSARYAHTSLENTNVRPNGGFCEGFHKGFYENKSRRLQELMMNGKTAMTTMENKEQGQDVIDNRSYDDAVNTSATMQHQLTEKEVEEQEAEDKRVDDKQAADQGIAEDLSKNPEEEEYDRVDFNRLELEHQGRVDHREFETEKSYPWMRMDPHVQNRSEKMYLYLMYKELKEKIDDLTKKELHACTRQRWDDALRLRDMKNELELIREKKIFNMKSLNMNEELREKILDNIDNRERALARRANACTDTTMYSDGAKVLWEKWVQEDDRFVIKDASFQRETLMKKLEDEFQNLALQDKELIAKTYTSVIDESHLHNRHQLNEELTEAKLKSA